MTSPLPHFDVEAEPAVAGTAPLPISPATAADAAWCSSSMIGVSALAPNPVTTPLPTLKPKSVRRDILGSALVRLHALSGADTQPESTTPHTASDVASTANDADRRVYPRCGARGAVSLVRLANDITVTARHISEQMVAAGIAGELLDLSRNGAALVLLQAMNPGDRIALRLCQSSNHQHAEHQYSDHVARVVRSVDIGAGLWKIVAQFEKPLSFEAAYQLFEREPNGSDAEIPAPPATEFGSQYRPIL